MVAHINYAGIDFKNIVDEINVKNSPTHTTNNYVGGDGSNTTYVSSNSRIITFKLLSPSYEENEDGDAPKIQDYLNLFKTYKKKTAVLTSQSHLNLKGNYMFTDFSVTEDAGNNFECSCEFTEVVPFNSTKKTFRVWGNVSSTSKNKKTTTKTKPFELNTSLDSNTKVLLVKCGVLVGLKETKSFICVKRLQKFLQKQGFYTKYAVDGKLGKQTTAAIKQFQTSILSNKSYGNILKANGLWDKQTVLFLKKAYNLYTKNDLVEEFGKTKVLSSSEVHYALEGR